MKTALIILTAAAVFIAAVAAVNTILYKLNLAYINKNIQPVAYKNQLSPIIDNESSIPTFVTDNEFKIIHLTDIHIGAGWMSYKKDRMALRAVSSMIKAEKPDLAIITGDIAYPVFFQSGTFNNKTPAALFGTMMNKLGVYWAPVFGNHDTEAYSYYSRKNIGKYYEKGQFKNKGGEKNYCIFKCGDSTIDGVGNYIINIQNTQGIITQSLFLMDTGSYADNDYFGMLWKYDGLHQNQIDWYEKSINNIKEQNQSHGASTPSSLLFIHIPLNEYKNAWIDYTKHNNKNTLNTQYISGTVGEKSGIFCSAHPDSMFNTMQKLGSTKGVFCGHDHLNNFSLIYKGICLSYGFSIDYLAYIGIKKYGAQRGCGIITVSPGGSFKAERENFYQHKYLNDFSEPVSMAPYYKPEQMKEVQ